MSFGIYLEIHEPPLDVDALRALIARLPGVSPLSGTEAAGSTLAVSLSGGSVWVFVDDQSVSINFHWMDNRYGHGALVGRWLLERHRCTGQCTDYGTPLADNAACLEHLDQLTREPQTLERAQAVCDGMHGAQIASIALTREELHIHLARAEQPAGVLILYRDVAAVELGGWSLPTPAEDPGHRALLAMVEMLDDVGITVMAAEASWRDGLTLRFGFGGPLTEETIRVVAQEDSPEELLWRYHPPDGAVEVVAFAGGGPMVRSRAC